MDSHRGSILHVFYYTGPGDIALFTAPAGPLADIGEVIGNRGCFLTFEKHLFPG